MRDEGMPAIMEAHNRALVALLNATDMTEEEADEVITSIVALVFQTIKEYLPNEGDMKCN
jgi:hypothetical protein